MNLSEAKVNFTKIVENWGEINPNDISNELDDIYVFINSLINIGWSRKKVYELIKEMEADSENFQEGVEVVLWDYETALVGSVAPSCIIQFPNEKISNESQLVDYVRSGKWKE